MQVSLILQNTAQFKNLHTIFHYLINQFVLSKAKEVVYFFFYEIVSCDVM